MTEHSKPNFDTSKETSISLLFKILGTVAAGAAVAGSTYAAKKVHDKRQEAKETEDHTNDETI